MNEDSSRNIHDKWMTDINRFHIWYRFGLYESANYFTGRGLRWQIRKDK